MSHSSLAHDIDIDAVITGDIRLDAASSLRLYQEVPLHELGKWAAQRCQFIHGEQYRTYVIDRNINYTNICSAHCTFCAFKRNLGDTDAYLLNTQALHEKVRQLVNIGGTQILLQGGMHPELPIEFYEQMLRDLKSEFPSIHIHGFSPPEIVEFVAVFKLGGFSCTLPNRSHELSHGVWQAKLEAILTRLCAAGLDSIPGGGGEIFVDRVRRRIGIGKATADQWLKVMSCAHQIGMFTSATMMFGHIESVADRIDHMLRVRVAQDRAIEAQYPGRYLSFISWPFQPDHTPLGKLASWDPESGEPFAGDDPGHPQAGKQLRLAGATDYLRTQALSRLVLDNIQSITSSWVTVGPKIGQLGLFYGANDMGSVMMEENVVSAAGTTYCLNEPVLCHLIREAGFIPAQRDNQYRHLHVHEGQQSPDHQVEDWSTHRRTNLHRQRPGDEGGQVPLTVVGDRVS